MTDEQKQKAKAARLERKRLQDLELERQLQEIRDRKRSQSLALPARDSSLRGKLTYNAWGYGQRTGQVFRGHCGR